MKKVFLLFILVVSLNLLSGCSSNNQLKCTMLSNGNNMNAYVEVTVNFKNNIAKTYTASARFQDITTDNLDENWDSIKAQFNEQNYPTEADGFKRTTKSDDKNHTFTVTMEVDINKINQSTMDKFEIENSFQGKTRDQVKDALTKEGMACE